MTFVLEESGVTATVEVPCEADVAAAKEVACTALAVSPASVEMRIGTQVLEGTCRLQDTAFGAGVQVVLARRFADIKCPAEYSTHASRMNETRLSLSPCGALCIFTHNARCVTGLDTETFSPAFNFKVDMEVYGAPAISLCKTRCYLPCKEGLHEVALPGGEVLRKVGRMSSSVFACGGVVASFVARGTDGVSVYDEDLTLLRTLPHEQCKTFALSDCGGWVITSSRTEQNARLWDVNTGEAVACVPAKADGIVAFSRSAPDFAVVCSGKVQLYDRSGAALGSFELPGLMPFPAGMQFTLCGKYLVVRLPDMAAQQYILHQYDVATGSCVRVIPDSDNCGAFAISPCSRVVLFANSGRATIETRYLHPY